MMTEQEEAVGRERLGELVNHQKRLVDLGTDKDVRYPVEHERHNKTIKEYDALLALIKRFETDQLVVSVRLMDAQKRVDVAQEELAEAQSVLDVLSR